MSIPKRIIQTHRDFSLCQDLSESWIVKNPDYDYRFYDDEMCVKFFKKHYPRLLSCYLALPNNGQKADLFRYVSVFHYGGFYFDADTYCKVSLDTYVDLNHKLVVGYEMFASLYKNRVETYVEEYASPKQMLQWAFAAEPGSSMLKNLIKVIYNNVTSMRQNQLKKFSSNARFNLELTGPIAFTSAFNYYMVGAESEAVQILPQLNWGYIKYHNKEVDPMRNDDVKLLHYFKGSWRHKA
ncbi:glycosyltransferase family 32 protein [Allochromatium palmeri]|uniref:Glycosyl transferase n=1 Tax=Allochromatium palmeri TaxID=231048 RepID=A0A6N8EJT9_9GAMM|nr:glycosyltransferase [Allochromatium palmeri]MTW23016.1 hypothetical protein [Allochromatium palmeri]